jgi:hypothetical protein
MLVVLTAMSGPAARRTEEPADLGEVELSHGAVSAAGACTSIGAVRDVAGLSASTRV